jgi:hypothetical protein
LIALAIAALAIAALAIVASVLVGVLAVGVRLAVGLVNRSSSSMSRPSIVVRDSRDALSWEYFLFVGAATIVAALL